MLACGRMHHGMIAPGFRIAADTCNIRTRHDPADIGRITAFVPDHATALGIPGKNKTCLPPGASFRESPARGHGFRTAVAQYILPSGNA